MFPIAEPSPPSALPTPLKYFSTPEPAAFSFVTKLVPVAALSRKPMRKPISFWSSDTMPLAPVSPASFSDNMPTRNAISPATTFVIVFVISGFFCTKVVTTPSISVAFLIRSVSTGSSISPSSTCNASHADCISVICPFKLSSFVSAIAFAAPSALLIDAASLSKSTCSAFISARKPDMPDSPAIFLA